MVISVATFATIFQISVFRVSSLCMLTSQSQVVRPKKRLQSLPVLPSKAAKVFSLIRVLVVRDVRPIIPRTTRNFLNMFFIALIIRFLYNNTK